MLAAVACGILLAYPKMPKLSWTLPPRYKAKTVLNRAARFPSKTIALTFDDGPDPKVTPLILDVLGMHRIKATFFVLGPAARNHPDLLRRMVREGHCIGNHSWTHGKERTDEQAVWEILRTNAEVRRATGNEPTIFRTPYGIRDGAYAARAKAMGMSNVLWTAVDGDTVTDDVDAMIAHIGTPRNGEIILCHDGPGKSATPTMLKKLLPKLIQKGYGFATVPNLLREWDRHMAGIEELEARTANAARTPSRSNSRRARTLPATP